jgi:hypothetical protein
MSAQCQEGKGSDSPTVLDFPGPIQLSAWHAV